MQTFLPYSDFSRTVSCLDKKRLWKQTIEAREIIQILEGKESCWKNHPAVKMWIGYVDALKSYYNECLHECKFNRHINTKLLMYVYDMNFKFPPWFGDKEFHRSHQSNLIRKMPEHYQKLFPDVPNNLPYVWPINVK